MNRNLISGLAIGVFAGFLAGYFTGASRSNEEVPQVAAAPAAQAPAMPPRPNPMELQQRIAANQQVVAADPKNLNAWIALGNDYFDLQQAQNSVDAYAKALALQPGNSRVLVDQGVMYRQLQQFDKAVANFKQATRLDPKLVQGWFNLGIVCSQDLKKPDEAVKAWTKVIEVAPESSQAAQAQQFLAQLKQGKP